MDTLSKFYLILILSQMVLSLVGVIFVSSWSKVKGKKTLMFSLLCALFSGMIFLGIRLFYLYPMKDIEAMDRARDYVKAIGVLGSCSSLLSQALLLASIVQLSDTLKTRLTPLFKSKSGDKQ